MSPAIQRGADPDLNTPADRAQQGACHGCPQWEKCLFHLKRHFAFKGLGKKNVAYRVRTDAAERHGAKEDFMACEVFVDTMQDRMLTGQALRAQGKDGDIIKIIGIEGTTIKQRFQVGFNTRNQIIRPQPHLVEPLKKAGYNVNLDDHTSPMEFRPVTIDIVVPEYVDPLELYDAYAAEMARRAEDEETTMQELEDAAFEQAMARQRKEDAKPSKAPPVAAPLGKA